MKYLKAEEILVLNARVVEQTGGTQGVRETNLLHSLVERPRSAFAGKGMYPTVFDKAAVYFHSLIRYHVFLDGNKRTSLTVAARFLHMNGYVLDVSNKEAVRFTLATATEETEIQGIAAWFKEHAVKTSI